MCKLVLKRINIITGHYGSGKTNLAVNLALSLAAIGQKTCLVDLDIVNPYFRAADMTQTLEQAGVRVIMPIFARTNLDLPALPGEVNAVFDDKSYTVILDVGGDDSGAAALGRYAKNITVENNYAHFYVINARRILTQKADEAVSILHQIEKMGRVPVTQIVNNTNLAGETEAEIIKMSVDFANEVSRQSGLPLAFTSVKKSLAAELHGQIPNIYPVDIFVNPPW